MFSGEFTHMCDSSIEGLRRMHDPEALMWAAESKFMRHVLDALSRNAPNEKAKMRALILKRSLELDSLTMRMTNKYSTEKREGIELDEYKKVLHVFDSAIALFNAFYDKKEE